MSEALIHTMAMAEFYNGTVENELKTREMGRPIHDDVVMVRIYWSGNAKSELHCPAHDRSDRYNLLEDRTKVWLTWAEAFPKQWEAFNAGHSQDAAGTPISELPFLTEARRKELRAVNIRTAEQLAALSDATTAKLGMGISDLRRKAQAFLERAAGAAMDERHAHEMDEMRHEIEKLRSMVSASAKTPRAKAAEKPVLADISASPFSSMDADSILAWCSEADPEGQLPVRHHRMTDETWHRTMVQYADGVNARLKEAALLDA